MNTLGYIEYVTHGLVMGWVSAEIPKGSLVVEIDGETVETAWEFRARDDLIRLDLDGYGFSAYFNAPSYPYDLAVGSPACEPRYLVTSETRSVVSHVVPFPNKHAILSGDELNEIAAAIEPDTETYHSFVAKYHRVDGVMTKDVDVLFVDGTGGSISTRYRINYLAEGLQERGYATRYASPGPTPLEVISNIRARVVVFFRAPLTDDYEHLVSVFRSRGAIIIYDIDDLVVDPSIIHKIDGVRYLSSEETKAYENGMRLYRAFANYADKVTCSTPFLADYVHSLLGVKTEVIRNSIGRRYVNSYADEHQSDGPNDSTQFVVGYYSGSKTHQKDFARAAGGIYRFLNKYRSAVLRVVGALDLEEFPVLKSVANQIITVPLMPFHMMIEDLANCNVIIAPLETGDPFCESKSELKFFEAALRNRPCIASPTRTYREAMGNGEFGLLADSDDEWFEALEALLLDPEKRTQLGRKALKYVRETYTYREAAEDAAQRYFDIVPKPKATVTKKAEPVQPGEKLDIGVIIPGLVIGGGGHRKILRFCHDWSKLGHKITIYVATHENAKKVANDICTYFFEFEFEVRIFKGHVDFHDAIICTHWSTAYAMRLFSNPKSVFYFIQDFEPMFAPVSTDYVKAIQTYQMGFNLMAFGAWVADRVTREVGNSPYLVDFSIDLDRYQIDSNIRRNIDILFFARPGQPRRCFELGVEALRLIQKENPAIRIALYGEPNYGDLGFTYHNFGIITNLDKLAQIYNRSKTGICFSTTNPSAVGYEMIACGTNLVDLKVPGWEHNFGGEDFVHYASPTAESVAAKVLDALSDPAEMEVRARRGLAYVAAMPDDSHIGETMMRNILDVVKGRN